MTPFEVTQGDSTIVLGIPHAGTFVPGDVWQDLNANGRALADTDWHIDRLYDGLIEGATTVRANFHRYVIDANRDPSGESLYPGQNTTGLVPVTDFDGEEIWTNKPDAVEISRRQTAYHTPYHTALSAELERVRARHGVAILYDCHSIRSGIPFLFDGVLPDFNVGTNLGATCAPEIATAVEEICAHANGYSSVSNGRFKGGWTTRHYGDPSRNMHAIQMELAQSVYLRDEAEPWEYDAPKAAGIRAHLGTILATLNTLATTSGGIK